MSDGYVIQIDDKIDSSISEKIISIGAAAQISNKQIERLQKNLNVIDKNALATERLAAAQNRTQTTAQRLAAATDRAALAHMRLEAAQKRQEEASRRAAASNESVGSSFSPLISRLLQIAAAYVSIRELLQLGNAYVDLENKLRVVTTSEEQLAEVSERVFQIANKTRVPVEETAKAFSRFDLALMQLGASQEETLRLTETVNKALIVSGANTGEAASGLLQLSQAFNKGKLDGDEFRSVMELMPTVADAIAKQLGVTRGELLKLAPQGKITADVLRKGLAGAADEIDKKFAKTIPTLNQSLTIMKNKAIEAMGELEKKTGIFSSLASGVTTIADVILRLSPSTVILGTAFKDLAKEVFTLSENLFGADAGFKFLKRTIQGVGFILATVAETLQLINLELEKRAVYEYSEKVAKAVKNLEELKKSGASTLELKNATEQVLVLTNLGIAAAETASKMQAAETPLEKWARGVEEAEKQTAKLVDTTSKLRPAGAAPKAAVDKKELEDQETRAKLLARITAELNKEADAFGIVGPAHAAYLKMTEIELRLGDKKLKNSKNGIKLTEEETNAFREQILINETNKKVQSEANKIYEDAAGSLINLNNTIQANSILLTQGLITQDQFNKNILIAKNVYISAIDPLREINKGLAQENELLNFVGQAQQIENRMQQIRNELLTKGIILSSDQEKTYKDEISAILQKNLVNQEQNKIYDDLIGKTNLFKAQLEALVLLMAGGASNIDMSAAKISLFGNMFDGTQEAFDDQLKQREIFYSQVDQLRQKDLISEKTSFQLKKKADLKYSEDRLQMASTFFGNFAALQNSGSRQVFEIGKAAAIAQATIDGILGVQKALASLPPPYSYIMAASTAVLTAANVAKISSTQFGGGYWTGGEVPGGPQMIMVNEKGRETVMNASATARHRPILDAMNRGENLGAVGAGSTMLVKIENYGTSKEFDVSMDENRVKIIARDEARQAIRRDVPTLVSSDIANPNSTISKSIDRNTTAARQR
jgi:tape measure domain-containing protein